MPDNFNKFIKDKLNYNQEELLKKVPKEYHSVINVFMKRNADTLPKHQEKDHTIQLEKSKSSLFVQNYSSLLD